MPEADPVEVKIDPTDLVALQDRGADKMLIK